jgi:hypothetical protein
MRMWMCDPKILCQKHLLGEHNEIHKFIGHIRLRRSIDGYIHNNLISPMRLQERHDLLVVEMLARKYNHKTPVDANFLEAIALLYPKEQWGYEVDAAASLADLLQRCPWCRRNHGIQR